MGIKSSLGKKTPAIRFQMASESHHAFEIMRENKLQPGPVKAQRVLNSEGRLTLEIHAVVTIFNTSVVLSLNLCIVHDVPQDDGACPALLPATPSPPWHGFSATCSLTPPRGSCGLCPRRAGTGTGTTECGSCTPHTLGGQAALWVLVKVCIQPACLPLLEGA